MTKIAVIGLGYVGLSNALLLAKRYNVVGIDIDSNKVNLLSNKISPIKDEDIEKSLREERNIVFTTDTSELDNSDYVILAVPTNYDEETNYFDTSILGTAIETVLNKCDPKAIIIKSTIPIGYTDTAKQLYYYHNIIFVPEFLREGTAYRDAEYPDRIIVGSKLAIGTRIMKLFTSCIENKDLCKQIFMENKEAEAVKLFANSYLAMRVAYFNELDTYAEVNNLNTADIIKGVCSDNRIGDFYNNPSFGYGGYCFPKDTKQLLANYKGIPNELISSIVKSNETRKQHIVDEIISKNYKTVGIYKLAMKANSDNCRQSAILDIIDGLLDNGIAVIIYDNNCIKHCPVYSDINQFVEKSDIILANRIDDELAELDIMDKVYTRDCFRGDI